MTALAIPAKIDLSLPALVDRAAKALAGARSSAEILEARDMAGVVYDVAKKAARLAAAKGAFNSLVAAANRAQANALEIEAGANRRLADEYDAAQERGEVAKHGQKRADVPNGNISADLGITRKAIHEAREVRDAEEADPGIVRRTLDEALDAGKEPTRAKVKRAVKAKVKRAVKAKSKRTRKPRGHKNTVEETQHDRDLRMLLGMWEAACATARQEFLQTIETRG